MAMQITVNCKQHQAYQYGAFHEAFIHIGRYSSQRRWRNDASMGIEVPEGVDAIWYYTGDAIFTRFNAPLNLSIQRFPRSLYTYRKIFWPAPVARRCILGNRSLGGCGCDLVLQWRCKFHSIECSLRRINTVLSAKLLYT
jgi:hypothetical protein